MTPFTKCLESCNKMTNSEHASPFSTYEASSFSECAVLQLCSASRPLLYRGVRLPGSFVTVQEICLNASGNQTYIPNFCVKDISLFSSKNSPWTPVIHCYFSSVNSKAGRQLNFLYLIRHNRSMRSEVFHFSGFHTEQYKRRKRTYSRTCT